jgi:hypothetical protein
MSAILLATVVVATGATAGEVGHRPGAGSSPAKTFLEQVGELSICVFPTVIMDHEGETYDHESAALIAAFLDEAGIAASASVVAEEVDLSASRSGVQWKVFKGGLKQVAGHLKRQPIETDYAFVAHLLVTRTRKGGLAVGGIQCYLLDVKGKDAYSFLLNSHHDFFTEAKLIVGDDTLEAAAELRTKATNAVVEALRAQLQS